jgi:hypothetical protein
VAIFHDKIAFKSFILKTIMNRIKFILWKAKNQFRKIPGIIQLSFLYARFLPRGGCKYLHIFSYTNYKEREALYNIAKKLKDNSVIVEVGSHLGATSCMLALGSKSSKVFCVDTWKNDTMPEGLRDTFPEFKKNTKDFANIIPLRGTSENVAKTFNEKIDLIFIDGDHSYEGVKTDVFSWISKCKNDAIVVFHDIEPGCSKYGVNQVIKNTLNP